MFYFIVLDVEGVMEWPSDGSRQDNAGIARLPLNTIFIDPNAGDVEVSWIIKTKSSIFILLLIYY